MAKLKPPTKGLPAHKGRIKEPELKYGSNMGLHPKFSFSHIQSGAYCLSQCSRDDKAALADSLHKLSRLTWGQIFKSGRHGLGFEKIKAPRLRMPDQFREYQTIAFRFNGLKAFVGALEHDTFYIFWLDHNFTLYNHG
jgi:hypothetical protein